MQERGMFRVNIFGGYNKEDVNNYIQILENDMEAIKIKNNMENMELKSEFQKLQEENKMLIEKLGQCRQQEDEEQLKVKEGREIPQDALDELEYLQQENKRLKELLKNSKTEETNDLEEKLDMQEQMKQEIQILQDNKKRYEEEYKAIVKVLEDAKLSARSIEEETKKRADEIIANAQKEAELFREKLKFQIDKELEDKGIRLMAAKYKIESYCNYIKKENLYCRVNAFSALYAFGHPLYIAKAVHIQDEREEFLNEKILKEGLMSFDGDHSMLMSSLWDEMGGFSDRTQLAVINYIRFQSGSYGAEMLQIASDNLRGKEVRLAAMRYFGKYYYYPAQAFLLELLDNCTQEDWEYAVVSASALGNYHDPKSTEALKRALYSSNWYIRRNAAESLIAHHPPFKELTDIINGPDRYAREILMYQLESEELKEKGR